MTLKLRRSRAACCIAFAAFLAVPAIAQAGVIFLARESAGESVDLTTASDFVHFVGSASSGAAAPAANGLPAGAVLAGTAFTGFTTTYTNGIGFGEISIQDKPTAALLRYGTGAAAQSKAIWFGDYGGTTGVSFNVALPSASGVMNLYMGGFCGTGGSAAATIGGSTSTASFSSPSFCDHWGARYTMVWSGQAVGDVVEVKTANLPLVLGPNPGDRFGNSGPIGMYLGALPAMLDNGASIDNPLGGTFVFPSSLANLASGTIVNRGALSVLGGLGLSNAGFLDNKSTGSITNAGTIDNTASGYVLNAGSFSTLLGGVLGNAGYLDNVGGAKLETAGMLRNETSGYLWNAGLASVLGGASLQNAGMVENDAAGTVRNLGTLTGLGGSSFINAGRVENGAGGLVSLLGGASFQNSGTVDNQAGGTVRNLGTLTGLGGSSFINAGRVENGAGGLVSLLGGASFQNSGTVDNQAGGTVRNLGTLTGLGGSSFINAGRVENGAGGLVNLLGGASFQNSGTVDNQAGGMVRNLGMLTSLGGSAFTNAGAVENNAGALLRMLGGASFQNSGRFTNAAGAEVQNSGTFTNMVGGLVDNAGKFVNDSSNTIVNSGRFDVTGVLTNTTTGTITNTGTGLIAVAASGLFSNAGMIGNDGMISNEGVFVTSAGGSVVGSGSFLQLAGMTQIDGAMEAGSIEIRQGTLAGSGRLASGASVVIGSLARLAPGSDTGQTGTLALDGDADISGEILFDLGIGVDLFDMHGGRARFHAGADIRVNLTRSALAGDEYLLLDAAAIEGLDLVQFHVSGIAGGTYAFEQRDGDLYLRFLTPAAAIVPQPGVLALLLAGLLAFPAARRRRCTDA